MREIYKTNIERIMSKLLAEAKIKAIFQYPIRCRYGYILDYAIPEIKLAIECDGEHWHKKNNSHDRKRDWVLRKLGWRVLRFRGKEIETDGQKCINRIKNIINDNP